MDTKQHVAHFLKTLDRFGCGAADCRLAPVRAVVDRRGCIGSRRAPDRKPGGDVTFGGLGL